ncbi:hypothetical protein AB7294_09710 [Cylindrospermopsis raciborskii UAM/DH-MRr]|uniref:hypothetical protein n=1 Tax=Cylindrospermopsis raciborskii TaxID=77022 RepID=UPI00387A34A9
MLKKMIFYSTCLSLLGCQGLTLPTPKGTGILHLGSPGCPDKPRVSLNAKNVEKITFNQGRISKSNQVSVEQHVGYTFAAIAGDKLSYSTDSDVCVWVFTPDTEIVKGKDLLKTGQYTIQVGAPQGVKNFNLEVGLGSTLKSDPVTMEDSVKKSTVIATTAAPIPKTKSQIPPRADSVQKSYTATQNTSRISPEQVIRDYYDKINNKQYDTAWDIYPSTVKEDLNLHPNGYDSFLGWWTQVESVRVIRVGTQSEDNDSAIVNFRGQYSMKNGRLLPVRLRFYLDWNQDNATWYVTQIKVRTPN